MKLFIASDGNRSDAVRELPDIASVSDHEDLIKDNCVLYLVFREGVDRWEPIEIVEIMDEDEDE